MAADSRATAPFRWQDGERLILFGRGTLAGARDALGGPYTVLSTPRALAAVPELVAGADAVHLVGPGRVDALAGELRGAVRGELLLAIGGGRVIDTAKALAAADPPRRVAAIPTTLSGAEMTSGHRHAAGVALDAPRVRPALVINDPALSASQPLAELAASAGNALGHAAEGPLTPLAGPVARLAALEAARLMARALGGREPVLGEDDRDALALAALLAGYVIDSTKYGLHHVVSQTLVRFAGLGHGQANTAMLPHTLGALEDRAPAWIAELGAALGGGDPARFAARLGELAGVGRLREAGVSEEQLERCATEAAARPELALTAPAAGREELLALYRAAY